LSSGGIALIYGFIVDDRTWITMDILDFANVKFGTVLYENQGVLVAFNGLGYNSLIVHIVPYDLFS